MSKESTFPPTYATDQKYQHPHSQEETLETEKEIEREALLELLSKMVSQIITLQEEVGPIPIRKTIPLQAEPLPTAPLGTLPNPQLAMEPLLPLQTRDREEPIRGMWDLLHLHLPTATSTDMTEEVEAEIGPGMQVLRSVFETGKNY